MTRQALATMSVFVLSVLVTGIGPAAAQVDARDRPPVATVRSDASATAARRLERIARRLHGPRAQPGADSLRVDLDARVGADSPAPVLFEPGDLAIGAPVYGGATHDEILTLLTPAPLRSTAPYRRLRPSLPLGR